MTTRRVAGWAVLSLIPLVFVILALTAGQLAEFAIGLGIAAFCCLACAAGLWLLTDERRGS